MTIRPIPKSPNFAFDFRMTTATYSILQKAPGFFKWEGTTFVFRPTPAMVKYLRANFEGAEWIEGAESCVKENEELTKIAEQTRAAKIALTGDERELDNYDYKLEPWAHQRKAFLVSRDQPAFALLMEQRTGKTKVSIDTAAYLFRERRIHTLVVISVNGVHRNWVDTEIPKHLPEWCRAQCWFSRATQSQEHWRNFERTLNAPPEELRFFAFHVEGLSREGRTTDAFRRVMTGRGSDGVLLIMDESTRIKNRSSGRSKFLARFGGDGKEGERAGYRRILTGTPYVKDPMDFYGQFYFLDPKILGIDTETAFKARYCVMKVFEKDPEGNYKMVGPNSPRNGQRFERFEGIDNAEELSSLVDGFSYRVLRKDCMDIPPKVYKRFPVEMTVNQERLYRELLKDSIAEFRGRTVTARMAMTKATRLQQILCGWWPMNEEDLIGGDTWTEVRQIDAKNPRLEALQTIVESTDDKILVWSRFRPDLALIQDTFGQSCVSYHGGVNDEQRARNLQRFKTDPKVRIFAANPASAGLGLDLSIADTSVYYANGWDLEHRLQSEDRTEGKGNKKGTAVWDLEVPGTQDTKVIANLRSKKSLADIINRDPMSLFMENEQ
jgi:hypothetical protein